MAPTCLPGANSFIQHWFGDCIYNVRDLVGFLLGMASILSWMVAQVPQLMANYRNKSADALSAFFLAEWLLGDTCNLLGALLKGDQLSTVVFTAQYFICMDVVLLVQYIYYTSYQRRREHIFAAKHHHHKYRRRRSRMKVPVIEGSAAEYTSNQRLAASTDETASTSNRVDTPIEHVLHRVGSGGVESIGRDFVFRPQRVMACFGLMFLFTGLQWSAPITQSRQQRYVGEQQSIKHRQLQVVGSMRSEFFQPMPEWSQDVGTVIAYCSSVLYLTSRTSQIYKNYKRRSAEGLALSMFFCAIAANTLYGLSIVLRAYSMASLRSSAPWLIGSLGTVALDTTIFIQALTYGTEKKHTSDEEEQLLSAENAIKY